MKQNKLDKSRMFKYGPRNSTPEQVQIQSELDINIKENCKVSQDFLDQKQYITKLLGIINKQKQDLDEYKGAIKTLSADLKNHKKLSSELHETVRHLSEQNDNLKKQLKSYQLLQNQLAKDNSDTKYLFPQLQKQASQEIKNDFFEKFMIISVKRESIYDQLRESNDKLNMLKPDIIYQYPIQDKPCQTAYKAILPQIVFPYGLKSKICRKSDSLSELNEILYGGLSPDKFKNISVLTFKTDESYIASHPIKQKTNYQIANPNNLYYCICLETNDFLDEETKLTNSKSKKTKFISLQKTYVFMTKIPLITFFVDILHVMVNDLKLRKAAIHATMDKEVNLNDIDFEFHNQYQEVIENNLRQLLELKFENEISFKAFSETIQCIIPCKEDHLEYLDCEWGAYTIFNLLKLEQFIKILSALLCEQQVVIISSQRNLLSASMQKQYIIYQIKRLLFNSLLRPFQWPHPFISTVSSEMLQILDSPVPVFVGVLNEEKFIIIENLFDDYQEILFVEFDGTFQEQLEIKLQTQKPEVEESSPSLLKLEKILLPYFVRLQLKDNINNRIDHKGIIPTPDEFEIKTYHEIFEQVKQFYHDEILQYLPQTPIYLKDKYILDYIQIADIIEKQKTNDWFISQFLKTQIFAYYLEGQLH